MANFVRVSLFVTCVGSELDYYYHYKCLIKTFIYIIIDIVIVNNCPFPNAISKEVEGEVIQDFAFLMQLLSTNSLFLANKQMTYCRYSSVLLRCRQR